MTLMPKLPAPARPAVVATLALLCAACGTSNVGVSTTFPTPLVEPLPVSIGVHLSDDLRAFVHEEEIDGYGKWRLDLGPGQEAMFASLTAALFASTQWATAPDAAPADTRGVLAPELAELQFSLPRQTRNDVYEVWLKYQMKLFDDAGQLVVDWPVTAYGKASTRDHGIMDGSSSGALSAAAVAAMRDAMVVMSLRFRQLPEVQGWLAGGTSPAAPGALSAEATDGEATDAETIEAGANTSAEPASEAEPEPEPQAEEAAP